MVLGYQNSFANFIYDTRSIDGPYVDGCFHHLRYTKGTHLDIWNGSHKKDYQLLLLIAHIPITLVGSHHFLFMMTITVRLELMDPVMLINIMPVSLCGMVKVVLMKTVAVPLLTFLDSNEGALVKEIKLYVQ